MDSGLKQWFTGGRWKGSPAVVVLAWVVTVLLLALCVLTMVLIGHTSAPFFSF